VSKQDRGLILVVHGDRKTQRAMHRILGSTLYTIDAVDNLAQAHKLLDQRVPALVVLDHRTLIAEGGREFAARAAAAGTSACLVLMSEHDGHDLPRLFTHGSLTNLLGNPMPILAEELTATALKLLRGDIFGLEKYMAWGVEVRTVELADAQHRSDAVDALTADVRAFGLGPRVASLASLVADELLSNALYNAPVDNEGRPTRMEEERYRTRPLTGRDIVSLRYACDARYLAIEINDRYGSVERATILEHLAKCSSRGASHKVDFHGTGAGMGLGLVYSCCNHLVFNLDPGKRTEVIALLDVRFKPAELGSLVSSFNLFVHGKGN
jgi:CheY-like chemotaxis protein